MRRCLTMVVGLLLLLVPVAWQAQQESPQRAAEQVLREVFDAHERMQWGRIVLLLHPGVIPLLHQSELRSVESMEQARAQPARNPDWPECVAEYFAKDRAKHENNLPMGYKVYGVASLDELRALSAEEFVARWLEVQDGRTQMMRSIEMQSPAIRDSIRRAGGDSAFLAQLPHQKRTVVGSIVENDSTIQVLYRTQFSDDPQGPPAGNAVAILRRAGRDWRLWPSEGGLFNENGSVGYAIGEMYAPAEEVQKRSKEIVSWDGKKVAAGRAYLTGFGDSQDEQALVIQVGRERVRIPRSAFAEVSRLLEIGFMVPER
jgi:hypothetical protein